MLPLDHLESNPQIPKHRHTRIVKHVGRKLLSAAVESDFDFETLPNLTAR